MHVLYDRSLPLRGNSSSLVLRPGQHVRRARKNFAVNNRKLNACLDLDWTPDSANRGLDPFELVKCGRRMKMSQLKGAAAGGKHCHA